jgi:hypothetical protein
MWNVKAKVIPVITGATGTISKSLRQYLNNIPGKHEIQKAAILVTGQMLPMYEYKTHSTGQITLHVAQIANKE